jgi:hypothetical protein
MSLDINRRCLPRYTSISSPTFKIYKKLKTIEHLNSFGKVNEEMKISDDQ